MGYMYMQVVKQAIILHADGLGKQTEYGFDMIGVGDCLW